MGRWKTIRLSITPTANRNSYRVARLVGALTQGSVLRPQPWAGKSQLLQSCCCLWKPANNNFPHCYCLRVSIYNNSPCCCCLRWGVLGVLPTVYCVCEGDEINTKSRVADGGFAFAWMVVPTVGKRVFLRAVSTIPTVMRCMTPSTATVQKAASGRSKSPAFAGTKTVDYRRPSSCLLKPLPIPPQGTGAHSRCV